MAVDFLHKRRDLLFIDIDFLDFVHCTIELLRADFLRRGQRSVDEILADFLHNLANFVLFARVDDADGSAFLACATRASRTVRVVFDVVGQSVVDDVRQVIDVESASRHVGRHEQLHRVLTEFLHRQVALVLREVAVQRLGVVAVANQFVGNLLCLDFRATENDGENARMEIDDALQGKVFVLRVHEIIDVIDVLRALVARPDDDFAVVVQVGLGDSLDFAAHRGREHQRVALFGQMLENFVDALRKAHIQHFVGLVEHDFVHVAQVGFLAVDKVDEAARRRDDDLRSALQRPHLLHN